MLGANVYKYIQDTSSKSLTGQTSPLLSGQTENAAISLAVSTLREATIQAGFSDMWYSNGVTCVSEA